MTKVMFIHGLSGSPRGDKARALQSAGFTVVLPRDGQLPYVGFDSVRKLCQDAVVAHAPDVIVGSSLGGAVALQLDAAASLVLMSPAVAGIPGLLELLGGLVGSEASCLEGPWKVPPRAIVIHSRRDEFVPLDAVDALMQRAVSSATDDDRRMIEAIEKSLTDAGYQPRHGRLIEAGHDHRLNHAAPGAPATLHPHQAMITAVKILASLKSAA
jgi:predicted esterase YcpF (UPF0227 family)